MKVINKIKILSDRVRNISSPSTLITYLTNSDSEEALVYYTIRNTGKQGSDLLTDLGGEEVLVGDKKIKISE